MNQQEANELPELIVTGHSNCILSLAFSADGKMLLSGSCDRSVILWEVETGTMKRRFRMARSASCAVCTPDGRIIVTEDGQVWDALTGKRIRKALRYGFPIVCSPDGKTLASTGYNRSGEGSDLILSDLLTGRVKKRFACSYYQPVAIFFSADGKQVIVIGSEQNEDETTSNMTTLCDIKTGTMRRTLRGYQMSSIFSASSPSSHPLFASDGSKIWDAETGQLYKDVTFENRQGMVTCTSVSPDDRLLAVGTERGCLMTYEVSTSRLLWQKQAHIGWIRTVIFTADSKRIASAGDDHDIHLWNVANGECERTFKGQGPTAEAAAFTSDGKAVISLYKDDSARLWRLDSAELERQETERTGLLQRYAPKKSNTARHLWSLPLSQLPDSHVERGMTFGSLLSITAVSPDGSLVALRGSSHSLLIWDMASGRVQSTMQDTYSPWGAVAFSPDNRFVAISVDTIENRIRLYDAATGDIVRELIANVADLWWAVELVFSADSRTLAVGHADHNIVLWDVPSGTVKRVLAAGETVTALSFSPDGKTLAVGTAYSPTVWIKSLQRTGKQKLLRKHTGSIYSVDYSPDGTRLATGAMDGTVRLWNASSGDLLSTALALPDGEWILYTPEGYYSGSPNAEKWLLWQVGSDLYPADTYSQRFRNPAEVQKKIQAAE